MSRYTKTQVTQLSANEQAAIDNINKNFNDIETAIKDTVSRSGNTPTHMTHDLDMNGKRIINVPAPLSDTDLVRRQDVVGDIALVQNLVNATTNAAAQTLKAAADVQEIIQDANVGLVADDLALGDNSKILLCGTNIDDIKDVADNISDIQTVNSNKENIDAVAGNETNINAVNVNKANIDSCASNMSAITDAPTQATNAANSALSASGSAAAALLSAQQAQQAALSVTGFDLFDHKWEDHLLSDMNWLRADTFSWQDGTVYSDAYDHLVADYNGGTSQTETVGSYTITYVLASDGHKITTDETNVTNIYNESGVAWYYVLDTANTRFKLPRSSHGNIVKKYQSGTEWYRVYSDGWCEQGGIKSAPMGGVQVDLLITMANTNYTILLGESGTTNTQDGNNGYWYDKSASSFKMANKQYGSNNVTRDVCWQVCGYLLSVPSNDQYKHLYFYVGQYSQTATEQTAGLNSELFNGKADVDLSNINPSSSTKDTVVSWGVPDYDSGATITLNTSGVTFTPTKSGMVKLIREGGDGQNGISMYKGSNSSGVLLQTYLAASQFNTGYAYSWVPVCKGETYFIITNNTNVGKAIFYPARGA